MIIGSPLNFQYTGIQRKLQDDCREKGCACSAYRITYNAVKQAVQQLMSTEILN